MVMAGQPVAEQVRELLEPHVERQGFELVAVDFRRGTRTSLLRLLIDRPEGGVTLDELERLSPTLGDLLDVYDPVEGRYTLEVASPGINRPLTKPRHFEAYRGRRVRIRTKDAVDGRRSFLGVLTTVRPEGVELDDEASGQRVAIGFAEIEGANYEHDFSQEFGGMARAQQRARARGRLH